MLLAFLLGYYLGSFPHKTTLNRKISAEVVVPVIALVISLVLSLSSVCAVWTPLVTNYDLHQGEFAGYLPLSLLSFPLYLVTYHTPLASMPNGIGNVSFSVYLSGFKVLLVRGQYFWPAYYGRGPIVYNLDPPFKDAWTLFYYLLLLFAVSNIVMVAFGTLLRDRLIRRKTRATQNNKT
jgi:hypothetical protein